MIRALKLVPAFVAFALVAALILVRSEDVV